MITFEAKRKECYNKKGLIPQSTLAKLKMCSGTPEEIKKKLEDYKNDPNLCQLLQCQPQDIMDWEVKLDPELSYERKFCEE